MFCPRCDALLWRWLDVLLMLVVVLMVTHVKSNWKCLVPGSLCRLI